jgi:prepilin-type N-terminal cleavage/methylation domain-containing protein
MRLQKGFSLIEIAFAVAVMGIMVFAVVYYSSGYFRQNKAEEVVKWVSDLKQAINKASNDGVSISSLTNLRDYLVVPQNIQEMNPQFSTSQTINCYNSNPIPSYSGYAVSLRCGGLCTALMNRLYSLGFCVSLSSGTLTVGVR